MTVVARMVRLWVSGLAVLVFGALSTSSQIALTEVETWTALDPHPSDSFGWVVDVDGERAIVAAAGDDTFGPDHGSVLILIRRGDVWHPDTLLGPPPHTGEDETFGWSVAIHGTTAVVGAPYDETGIVYVYEHDGHAWRRNATLTGDPDALRFGSELALDGDVLLVAAQLDSGTVLQGGSVFVFRRSDVGWTLEAKLIPSDVAVGDQFGRSIALQGDVCVIGAGDHDDPGPGDGAAYVFERHDGEWVETKLEKPAGDKKGGFGDGVAIHDRWIAVGSPHAAADGRSAVRMFHRTSSGWTHTQKVVEPNIPPSGASLFGWRLALQAGLLVVGALADDSIAYQAGAGYVYALDGPDWQLVATLAASDPNDGAHLGYDVAFDGKTCLLSAPHDAWLFWREGSVARFDLTALASDAQSRAVRED